jgi:hypothetical protein
MNGRCCSGLLEQRIETTSKVVSILIGWGSFRQLIHWVYTFIKEIPFTG